MLAERRYSFEDASLPRSHPTLLPSKPVQVSGPQSLPKPKPIKEDTAFGSAFGAATGQGRDPLPHRFAELKQEIATTDPEVHHRLKESWADVLYALRVGVAEIKAKGNSVIPEVSFGDLASGQGGPWVEEVKRRGVVIIRDVVEDSTALEWKQQVKDYVAANPQVTGFPADDKQVYFLNWSKAQVAARSHPNVIAVQRALLTQLCHADPSLPISLNNPVVYADRLRIRQPGDSTWVLPPHIDGGSLERWEDEPYRECYREILEGRWRDHDLWDIGRRLDITNDIYKLGFGQCNVFRALQGWLSMSDTGPGEGTLRVHPLIKESSAYILLRPFFRPTVPRDSPFYLWPSSWELNLDTSTFPNSLMGLPQELNDLSHPHLQTGSGGVVSIKNVRPGDMVFWHCDTVHAVEAQHGGKGDSSVMYIPTVPLTKRAAVYLVKQRTAFLTGATAPDFPGDDGEKGFIDIATGKDVAEGDAKRAMGLERFVESEEMSPGEQEVIKEANSLLGL